jgi:hypothetical protein
MMTKLVLAVLLASAAFRAVVLEVVPVDGPAGIEAPE